AGLACRPDLEMADRHAACSAWMARLLEVAQREGADRVHLARQNLSPFSLSTEREEIPFWVMEHGFQLGIGYGPNGLAPAPGLATVAADQIVATSGGGESELFAALKESCRRAVRKAERAGAQVWDATTAGNCVEAYYRIAQLSSVRTGEAIP